MCRDYTPPVTTDKDNLRFTRKLDIFIASQEWVFFHVWMEDKFAMDDDLSLLETAKDQYQQYVEIRRLCELVSDDDEPEKSHPPSPEDPLTTNEISISQMDRFLHDVHS